MAAKKYMKKILTHRYDSPYENVAMKIYEVLKPDSHIFINRVMQIGMVWTKRIRPELNSLIFNLK